MQNHVLLDPALKKVPQRLYCIFRSVGSTIRVLIRPNTILESRVLCREVTLVRVDRGNRRSKRIEIVEVESTVDECGIGKPGLNRLVDVQDIGMLIK